MHPAAQKTKAWKKGLWMLWLCIHVGYLPAQDTPYVLKKDRFVSATYEIFAAQEVFEKVLHPEQETILLSEIYKYLLSITGYNISTVPRGTIVYVGEKIPTRYSIETFSGKAQAEIWKIRISEMSKDTLKTQGFTEDYLNLDFLYMMYYPEEEIKLRAEERAHIEKIQKEKAEKQKQKQQKQAQKAFVEAAKKGNIPALKSQLKAGMDIHTQDETGWTALSIAVEEKQTETVRFLLQEGADPKIKNGKGQTPIQIAKKHEDKSILYILYAYRDR